MCSDHQKNSLEIMVTRSVKVNEFARNTRYARKIHLV